MKKILSIFMILILIFGMSINCFAEEKNTFNLTLNDALKMAEGSNLELKSLDKQVEMLEYQYNDAKSAADTAKLMSKLTGSSNAFMSQILLVPKQKYYDLSNARHNRDEKLFSVKNEVKKDYYQALLINDNIAASTEDINLLYDKMNEVNLRMKLGQMKQSDAENLKVQLKALQNQQESLKGQYNMVILSLKNIMALKESDNIILAPDTLNYLKFDNNDIDARISKAVENSFEIEKQNQSIKLLEIQDDIYGTEDIGYSIDSQKYALETVRFNVVSNIRSQYNNLISLQNNAEAEMSNLLNEYNNLRTVSIKRQYGMISAYDMQKENLAYSKQKNKTQSAINDYMMSTGSFKHLLGEE